MIYEGIIIERPKKEGELERILLETTPIAANNEQSAALKLFRMLDIDDVDEDRVDIIVRPFEEE